MKNKPLNQSEYEMKIIEDLGTTTATDFTTSKGRYAMCECTLCKQPFKVRMGSTKAKEQVSCKECTLNDKQSYKHPLYAIWNGIKQRCYSVKRKDYSRYGGIGVTMCAEWKNDVDAFIDWCESNGWNKKLVVDKDIKCRELNISPAVYCKHTISFITTRENSEEASAKVVMQYDKNMNFIAEHKSCVIAAESINKSGSKSSIANCCRNITKSSFGFKWKYK